MTRYCPDCREGMKKLGLLWLLIQNGSLSKGSVLFWDEPDANMHPKLVKNLINILFQLQKTGVQIFLATHSYVVLKEIALQKKKKDPVLFHSFYREKSTSEIQCCSAKDYVDLEVNEIQEAFSELYDQEIGSWE